MMDCPTVELFYDGAWRDITDRVNPDDALTIGRGRQDEQSQPGPSKCKLKLDNRDGRFSSRNPMSPLYGKIGRNTPLRVRIGTKDVKLSLPGGGDETTSYASTPDHASLDITGDIDIRVELKPSTWRPVNNAMVASKYLHTGDQRSWAVKIMSDGALRLVWSPDGTIGSRISSTSTAAVPDDDAQRAIAVTLQVNNGAGGHDVAFYTADTIAGPWTQLGTTVTTSGTTSIHSGTAELEVGANSLGLPFIGEDLLTGDVYAFQLRSGIDGTEVAEPDFTAQDAGDVSFTDDSGRVWTVHGGAGITDRSVRFSGEVSSWPQAWTSELDVWVTLEAAGIRRRLSQGAPTLRSAMYRGMTGGNVTAPRAYWPCEDGDKATSVASGLSGHPPMRVSGNVSLAAHSDLDSSEPIPTITTGHMQAPVPGYPATNFLRCMALVAIPDSITGTPAILYLRTNGSIDRWALRINSSGDLIIRALRASDDAVVLDSTVVFDILGQSGLIWIYLTKNGSSIDYQIGFAGVDSTSIGVASGTIAGTHGIATRVISGGGGDDLGGMAVGHITVLDTDEFWDILEFARAWTGETAIDRITRLCAEEDVPLRIIGPADDSETVGPQRVDTFLNLVDESAATTHGILADDRDATRLLLRLGATLYNQAPAVVLDYEAGHVSPPLEPTDDDQLTRNDITVQQPGGSSARAVLESGPLSVLQPPDGVGRYDDSRTLNVDNAGRLPQHASWLLHLGTVDEARYPTVTVLLHNPDVAAKVDEILATESGDRIQVTNPPPWLPPEVIDQLAQGYTEVHNGLEHSITFNCTPASPWTVAVADDAELGRAGTAGSELASAVTAVATSLSVATTLGPLWTTDAGQMPFDIRVGGEVMRVTAVTGASSPQTFTVSRSVNGISKAHAAGADVRLAQPAIAAL